jgi:PTH1 family peptidyl-tRNA hydrolase
MRLLVGLGNPGERYDNTRHNVGFACVDAVAEAIGKPAWKEFKDGLLALATVGNERVALFKPMQFMNNSGLHVQEVVSYYTIESPDLAVVCDDVYVKPGSARIRQSVGDGGHNGMKSLLVHLDPDTFWRVKIGAGLYEQHKDQRVRQPALEDYVLQKLPTHDSHLVEKVIDRLVPDLVTWLEHGTGLTQKTVHI